MQAWCLFVFKQEMVLKVSIIACCLLFICRGQRRPCSHPGGGEINHGCPGGWLFNPSTEETIVEWAGDGGCRWWFSCSCLLSQLLSCATSPEGFWRVKIFFQGVASFFLINISQLFKLFFIISCTESVSSRTVISICREESG